MMIALLVDPAETSVVLKPRANDSVPTNTPTVPAIPSVVVTAESQRVLTLRRL